MKKILFGVAALGLLGLAGAGLGLKAQDAVEAKAEGERIIYLKTNNDWETGGARFACYFFIKNGSDTWLDCDSTGNDHEYSVTVPEAYVNANAIFCRMDPAAAANNWDNKWNQTSDLSIADGNYATITGWDKSETWTETTIDNGAYLRGDWANGWSYSGQLLMSNESSYYEINGLILNAGSNIKAVMYESHVCNWPEIAAVSGDASLEGENIVIAETGIYRIRISGNKDSLNYTVTKTADEALVKAVNFAQSFNEDLSSICQMDGSTDFEDLNTEWTAKSDAYDLIKETEGVTAYLRGATTSSESSILATFAGKYDHILKATAARGEALTKGDFLGRSATAYNIAGFVEQSSDTAPWIVVGVPAIAALTIGGASIARKRRAE